MCYASYRESPSTFTIKAFVRSELTTPTLKAHMRDPDGYPIEVGQSTGLLTCTLANEAVRGSARDDGTQRAEGALLCRALVELLVNDSPGA